MVLGAALLINSPVTAETEITPKTNIPELLNGFASSFETSKNPYKFINQGLFGYMAYDAVKYFEDIAISQKENALQIPDMYYAVYQNIIAINHFNNEAYLFAHCYGAENNLEEM